MRSKPFAIEVGQEVFLKPTGNNSRRYDGKLVRGRIEKIARKYFYVLIDGHCTCEDDRFDKETFEYDEQDRNAGFVIYESIAAYCKDTEYEMMLHNVRSFFSNRYGAEASYDTLKAIHSLLQQERLLRPDRSQYSGV